MSAAMADLHIEGAFGDVSESDLLELNDATRGKLGTGKLGSGLGGSVFVDITPYARSFTTRRGATRADGPVLRYEAGTSSTVLRNDDRRFDPTNLSGPYVSAGVTQVQPMRSIRHRATWAGTTYELWRGYADSWDVGYPDSRYSEVTLSATDAFKVFQAYNRIAVGAAGAGEDSGTRIGRVLDSVSWASTDRDLATGDTTLQATTLEGVALDELQLVGESELGELFMDAGGRVVFRNRQAILTDARSNTSQATFGPGNLPYQDVTLAYDDTTLVNLAQVTREGGATQTAQDDTSIATYLTHTSTQDGLLMENDTEAQSYAQFVVFIGKDPELRFTQMVVKPQRDPANLWPQVLGREVGDRITVKLDPPGGGDTISRDVFIRGIEHAASPGSWQTTWTLQSATKYAFFVLNNATLGKLDSNALGY